MFSSHPYSRISAPPNAAVACCMALHLCCRAELIKVYWQEL